MFPRYLTVFEETQHSQQLSEKLINPKENVLFYNINFLGFKTVLNSRKIFSGRDTRQGWEGARLMQCRHVHQVMGLPDVRVHQDDAWPRPQREQRVLPPHG